MALEDSEFSPDADEGWNADKSEDETVAYGEGDDWGGNDLEAAYRRALEANDAVEWEFNQLPPTNVVSSDDGTEESAAGEQCLETPPARTQTQLRKYSRHQQRLPSRFLNESLPGRSSKQPSLSAENL